MISKLRASVISLLRRYPVFYDLAVWAKFLPSQFVYFAATFPNRIGHSSMTFPWSRQHWRGNISSRFELPGSEWEGRIQAALANDLENLRILRAKSGKYIPLSFSWPMHLKDEESLARLQPVSQVFPGDKYSFDDYQSYLDQYRQSSYAFTFKKGGWDCFRHLEIMVAGAVPVMPDINQCPSLAMAHYPKSLMSLSVDIFKAGQRPPTSLQSALNSWLSSHMTSAAMVTFARDKLPRRPRTVILVDPSFAHQPDYFSTMFLMGAIDVFGVSSLTLASDFSPIFEDWDASSSGLHGLGFGYTRLLSSELRSQISICNLPNLPVGLDEETLVVFANVSVNRLAVEQLNRLSWGSAQKLFLWGDDKSPTREQRRWLNSLDGFIGIRELY